MLHGEQFSWLHFQSNDIYLQTRKYLLRMTNIGEGDVVGPWIQRSSYSLSYFCRDLASSLRCMWGCSRVEAVGTPNCLGWGRDPTTSSILIPYNGGDITPQMCGTWQNWNKVSRALVLKLEFGLEWGPYHSWTSGVWGWPRMLIFWS